MALDLEQVPQPHYQWKASPASWLPSAHHVLLRLDGDSRVTLRD
jgi:hypothetical protein